MKFTCRLCWQLKFNFTKTWPEMLAIKIDDTAKVFFSGPKSVFEQQTYQTTAETPTRVWYYIRLVSFIQTSSLFFIQWYEATTSKWYCQQKYIPNENKERVWLYFQFISLSHTNNPLHQAGIIHFKCTRVSLSERSSDIFMYAPVYKFHVLLRRWCKGNSRSLTLFNLCFPAVIFGEVCRI